VGIFGGISDAIGSISGSISPGMGSAISAGSNLLGGILRNRAAAASADKSMEFQRWMAEHAHQMEVSDLRAAGLNPILSATGGSGARASGGATYDPENVGESVASSARAGGRIGAEIELLHSQAAANRMTAQNQQAQSDLTAAQVPEARRIGEIYLNPEMGPKAAAAKVANQSSLANKVLGTTLEGSLYNSARDATSSAFEKVDKWFNDRLDEGEGRQSARSLSRPPLTHPQNSPRHRSGRIYGTPWGEYEGNN